MQRLDFFKLQLITFRLVLMKISTNLKSCFSSYTFYFSFPSVSFLSLCYLAFCSLPVLPHCRKSLTVIFVFCICVYLHVLFASFDLKLAIFSVRLPFVLLRFCTIPLLTYCHFCRNCNNNSTRQYMQQPISLLKVFCRGGVDVLGYTDELHTLRRPVLTI